MHRTVTGVVMVFALAPSIALADRPIFVDSLVPQVITLPKPAHDGMRREMLGPAHPDSLAEWPRTVVMANLHVLEWPCRTDLFSKELEPGSPWLVWRSLGRVDVGDDAWYVAVLSCTDTLCASFRGDRTARPEFVLHDRLALLAIGRDRSRVVLLPPEPATIGDPGTAVIDSVAAIRGEGYTLLQVRRRLRSDHPCYDGGEYVASDEHYFLVLRGDSLAQNFVLVPQDEGASHDDEGGDSETERRAMLLVTGTSVRMAYEVEERQYSPDGDLAKTRRKVTRRGVVRLAYDEGKGRFRRLE